MRIGIQALSMALSLATVTVTAARADDPPPFALKVPEVRSGEPIFRFNGKDLAGFYTYLEHSKYDDPKRVIRVEDGVIRVTGEEFGGFATKEEYGDYHLIVEWKWTGRTCAPRTDKARDSGILLHAVGIDGAYNKMWLESIECQIIEGGCGDFILVPGEGKPSLTVPCVKKEDGQDYFDSADGTPKTRDSGRFNWWGRDLKWTDTLGFRGSRDVEKTTGEWNRMEVICDGDSITNIVNGVLVNKGTGSNRTRGKIQFQSEGAEILFRTIEVRPLLK
jgi:hypothetical protein